MPKLARVVSEDFLVDESKLDSVSSILSLEIGFWIELFPQSPTISLLNSAALGVFEGGFFVYFLWKLSHLIILILFLKNGSIDFLF